MRLTEEQYQAFEKERLQDVWEVVISRLLTLYPVECDRIPGQQLKKDVFSFLCESSRKYAEEGYDLIRLAEMLFPYSNSLNVEEFPEDLVAILNDARFPVSVRIDAMCMRLAFGPEG